MTTKVNASSLEESVRVFNNLKDIASKWCKDHTNYEYSIKIDHSKYTIDLNITKLDEYSSESSKG